MHLPSPEKERKHGSIPLYEMKYSHVDCRGCDSNIIIALGYSSGFPGISSIIHIFIQTEPKT